MGALAEISNTSDEASEPKRPETSALFSPSKHTSDHEDCALSFGRIITCLWGFFSLLSDLWFNFWFFRTTQRRNILKRSSGLVGGLLRIINNVLDECSQKVEPHRILSAPKVLCEHFASFASEYQWATKAILPQLTFSMKILINDQVAFSSSFGALAIFSSANALYSDLK